MEPRIDDGSWILQPGTSDASLLTRQQHHRSHAIWNGEDSGPLTCRGRTKEMANIQMRDNRTGEMARNHAYYQWYDLVTLKYVDRNSAKLHQLIESHLALLNWVPVGSREHNHIRRILYTVAGLGGDPAATGQANNRTETEPETTAALSTSAAPVTTPTRARRDIASPSTSVARGRGRLATASPSTITTRARGWPAPASPIPIAARGRGRPAIASPSTSSTTGRGRRATTPRVVSSHEIPAPILHASPHPEVPPRIPDEPALIDMPLP
nr:hypothetical protein CFP56_25589 [Quercus suber]